MSLEVFPLQLPGVLLLKPRVFLDERGFFCESFNAAKFAAATGVHETFVQDNHSRSSRGVLRGLHYQLPPAAQGKLVRVVVGEIYDVAVDIRQDSPTFGQWTGQRLSADNGLQMWIPKGLAHGFLTVSETADVLYKTTDYYMPSCERTILWNDPDLHIDWPLTMEPSLSLKDTQGVKFIQAEKFS